MSEEATRQNQAVTRHMVSWLREQGVYLYFGPELEYYLFKNGQKVERTGPDIENFQRRVAQLAEQQGIKLVSQTSDAGIGQYEMAQRTTDPVVAGEWAVKLKKIFKQVAQEQGLVVNLRPKITPSAYGNGFHVHMGIYNQDISQYINANTSIADGRVTVTPPASANLLVDQYGNLNEFARDVEQGLIRVLDETQVFFLPSDNALTRNFGASHSDYASKLLEARAEKGQYAVRIVGENGSKRYEVRHGGMDAHPDLVMMANVASVVLATERSKGITYVSPFSQPAPGQPFWAPATGSASPAPRSIPLGGGTRLVQGEIEQASVHAYLNQRLLLAQDLPRLIGRSTFNRLAGQMLLNPDDAFVSPVNREAPDEYALAALRTTTSWDTINRVLHAQKQQLALKFVRISGDKQKNNMVLSFRDEAEREKFVKRELGPYLLETLSTQTTTFHGAIDPSGNYTPGKRADLAAGEQPCLILDAAKTAGYLEIRSKSLSAPWLRTEFERFLSRRESYESWAAIQYNGAATQLQHHAEKMIGADAPAPRPVTVPQAPLEPQPQARTASQASILAELQNHRDWSRDRDGNYYIPAGSLNLQPLGVIENPGLLRTPSYVFVTSGTTLHQALGEAMAQWRSEERAAQDQAAQDGRINPATLSDVYQELAGLPDWHRDAQGRYFRNLTEFTPQQVQTMRRVNGDVIVASTFAFIEPNSTLDRVVSESVQNRQRILAGNIDTMLPRAASEVNWQRDQRTHSWHVRASSLPDDIRDTLLAEGNNVMLQEDGRLVVNEGSRLDTMINESGLARVAANALLAESARNPKWIRNSDGYRIPRAELLEPEQGRLKNAGAVISSGYIFVPAEAPAHAMIAEAASRRMASAARAEQRAAAAQKQETQAALARTCQDIAVHPAWKQNARNQYFAERSAFTPKQLEAMQGATDTFLVADTYVHVVASAPAAAPVQAATNDIGEGYSIRVCEPGAVVDALPQALRLLAAESTVEMRSVEQEMLKARRVAVVYKGNEVVGIGAIKRSRPDYEGKIAQRSGFTFPADVAELGYIAVAPAHRGHSLSEKIVNALAEEYPGPIFSTTADAAMKHTLEQSGFSGRGNSWQGRTSTLTLWQRDARPASVGFTPVYNSTLALQVRQAAAAQQAEAQAAASQKAAQTARALERMNEKLTTLAWQRDGNNNLFVKHTSFNEAQLETLKNTPDAFTVTAQFVFITPGNPIYNAINAAQQASIAERPFSSRQTVAEGQRIARAAGFRTVRACVAARLPWDRDDEVSTDTIAGNAEFKKLLAALNAEDPALAVPSPQNPQSYIRAKGELLAAIRQNQGATAELDTKNEAGKAEARKQQAIRTGEQIAHAAGSRTVLQYVSAALPWDRDYDVSLSHLESHPEHTKALEALRAENPPLVIPSPSSANFLRAQRKLLTAVKEQENAAAELGKRQESDAQAEKRKEAIRIGRAISQQAGYETTLQYVAALLPWDNDHDVSQLHLEENPQHRQALEALKAENPDWVIPTPSHENGYFRAQRQLKDAVLQNKAAAAEYASQQQSNAAEAARRETIRQGMAGATGYNTLLQFVAAKLPWDNDYDVSQSHLAVNLQHQQALDALRADNPVLVIPAPGHGENYFRAQRELRTAIEQHKRAEAELQAQTALNEQERKRQETIRHGEHIALAAGYKTVRDYVVAELPWYRDYDVSIIHLQDTPQHQQAIDALKAQNPGLIAFAPGHGQNYLRPQPELLAAVQKYEKAVAELATQRQHNENERLRQEAIQQGEQIAQRAGYASVLRYVAAELPWDNDGDVTLTHLESNADHRLALAALRAQNPALAIPAPSHDNYIRAQGALKVEVQRGGGGRQDPGTGGAPFDPFSYRLDAASLAAQGLLHLDPDKVDNLYLRESLLRISPAERAEHRQQSVLAQSRRRRRPPAGRTTASPAEPPASNAALPAPGETPAPPPPIQAEAPATSTTLALRDTTNPPPPPPSGAPGAFSANSFSTLPLAELYEGLRSGKIDYFQILGVPEGEATDTSIKKAYRTLASKNHPDKHTDASIVEQAEAEARFKIVKDAYDNLKDAEARKAYKAGGRAAYGAATAAAAAEAARLRTLVAGMGINTAFGLVSLGQLGYSYYNNDVEGMARAGGHLTLNSVGVGDAAAQMRNTSSGLVSKAIIPLAATNEMAHGLTESYKLSATGLTDEAREKLVDSSMSSLAMLGGGGAALALGTGFLASTGIGLAAMAAGWATAKGINYAGDSLDNYLHAENDARFSTPDYKSNRHLVSLMHGKLDDTRKTAAAIRGEVFGANDKIRNDPTALTRMEQMINAELNRADLAKYNNSSIAWDFMRGDSETLAREKNAITDFNKAKSALKEFHAIVATISMECMANLVEGPGTVEQKLKDLKPRHLDRDGDGKLTASDHELIVARFQEKLGAERGRLLAGNFIKMLSTQQNIHFDGTGVVRAERMQATLTPIQQGKSLKVEGLAGKWPDDIAKVPVRITLGKYADGRKIHDILVEGHAIRQADGTILVMPTTLLLKDPQGIEKRLTQKTSELGGQIAMSGFPVEYTRAAVTHYTAKGEGSYTTHDGAIETAGISIDQWNGPRAEKIRNKIFDLSQLLLQQEKPAAALALREPGIGAIPLKQNVTASDIGLFSAPISPAPPRTEPVKPQAR